MNRAWPAKPKAAQVTIPEVENLKHDTCVSQSCNSQAESNLARRMTAGPNEKARAFGAGHCCCGVSRADQKIVAKQKYRKPESIIAIGRVSTQAMAMLRTVDHCRPEPLADMVPAMPDDSTWVVETGRP
jgi:hypothetical protein